MSKFSITFEEELTGTTEAEIDAAKKALALKIFDFYFELRTNNPEALKQVGVPEKPIKHKKAKVSPAVPKEAVSSKEEVIVEDVAEDATEEKTSTFRQPVEKGEESPHIVAEPLEDKQVFEEEELTLEQKDDIMNDVFTKLNRTEKSETIVSALLDIDGGVSVKDLADATKMNYNDVSTWLTQTGKRVARLIKVSRGVYRLDRALPVAGETTEAEAK